MLRFRLLLSCSSDSQSIPCSNIAFSCSFPPYSLAGWLCDDDGWNRGPTEPPTAQPVEVPFESIEQKFKLKFTTVNEIDWGDHISLQVLPMVVQREANQVYGRVPFGKLYIAHVVTEKLEFGKVHPPAPPAPVEEPSSEEEEAPPAQTIPAKCYKKNGELRKRRRCQEAAAAAAAAEAGESSSEEEAPPPAVIEQDPYYEYEISLTMWVHADEQDDFDRLYFSRNLQRLWAAEICENLEIPNWAFQKDSGIADCEVIVPRKRPRN